MSEQRPIRVLFVCLGNICRSPMAEAVFLDMIQKRGVESRFEVDSAGTGGWHAGEEADPRTRETLTKHGIPYNRRARQLRSHDLEYYDYIFAMDRDNRANTVSLDPAFGERVTLMMDMAPEVGIAEVPDPYYGGPEGFERVFDMVHRACENFLNRTLDRDH